MTFALILFHAMPEQLLKLFSVGDNANRIQVGSEALRLCSIAFIPASLGVIMIAMFNAVGHGIKAMLISLLRQLCILVPLGYVLAIYTPMGLKGYWAAFPIAEALSVAIFFPIAVKTIKTILKRKPHSPTSKSSKKKSEKNSTKKLSKKKARTRLPENLQKGYNAYRFCKRADFRHGQRKVFTLFKL